MEALGSKGCVTNRGNCLIVQLDVSDLVICGSLIGQAQLDDGLERRVDCQICDIAVA